MAKFVFISSSYFLDVLVPLLEIFSFVGFSCSFRLCPLFSNQCYLSLYIHNFLGLFHHLICMMLSLYTIGRIILLWYLIVIHFNFININKLSSKNWGLGLEGVGLGLLTLATMTLYHASPSLFHNITSIYCRCCFGYAFHYELIVIGLCLHWTCYYLVLSGRVEGKEGQVVSYYLVLWFRPFLIGVLSLTFGGVFYGGFKFFGGFFLYIAFFYRHQFYWLGFF